MKNKRLHHKFVDFIPDILNEKTLYISITYATVAHKCVCGCENEVITPLSLLDWKMIFDGETISLFPSIGNWNFPCKSHYWINRSMVEWAPAWSREQINRQRDLDKHVQEVYFNTGKLISPALQIEEQRKKTKNNLWEIIKSWWT